MKGNDKTDMLVTMVKIARNEGFLRLYAGLSASIMRQATYSTVLMYIWQLLICSSVAGAMGGDSGNSAAESLNGLAATTICNPVDVIKTRVMSAKNSQSSFSIMTDV
ncbi:hypothetical protein BDC45DRAFT_555527 [Circinella umbellata]|nr:hypothetical protein BDC45DRAFT_555527 [Circinella umbellata]